MDKDSDDEIEVDPEPKDESAAAEEDSKKPAAPSDKSEQQPIGTDDAPVPPKTSTDSGRSGKLAALKESTPANSMPSSLTDSKSPQPPGEPNCPPPANHPARNLDKDPIRLCMGNSGADVQEKYNCSVPWVFWRNCNEADARVYEMLRQGTPPSYETLRWDCGPGLTVGYTGESEGYYPDFVHGKVGFNVRESCFWQG